MQAERWKQIEELFEAAQQEPASRRAASFCGMLAAATKSFASRWNRC
jgi:hypothetical protein